MINVKESLKLKEYIEENQLVLYRLNIRERSSPYTRHSGARRNGFLIKAFFSKYSSNVGIEASVNDNYNIVTLVKYGVIDKHEIDVDYLFSNLVLVKIKNTVLSSRCFGHGNTKARMMLTKTHTIESLLENQTLRDGTVSDVVVLYDNVTDKHYKFHTDDLEFILPDFKNIVKGYNIPKDRKILAKDVVKVVKKNPYKLPYGTELVVEAFQKAGNKKFCEVVKDNKTYSIEINKLKKIKDGNISKKETISEKVTKEAISKQYQEFLSSSSPNTTSFARFLTDITSSTPF